MQEFDRKTSSSSANANTEESASSEIDGAALMPAQMFSFDARPNNQTIQEKSNDKDEADDESQTSQWSLDFAGASPPPPTQNKNSVGNAQQNNPLQRKEAKAQDTTGATEEGHTGEVMSKMESAFGADFSNIKINKNSSDAEDMGALAYTKGNQIDFAPGQYNPQSQSGQELLGHELAHVVQQREGRVKANSSVNGQAVNNDPGLEKEADDLGKKAASGGAPIQKKKAPYAPSNSIGVSQFKLDIVPFPLQMKKGNEDTTPVNVNEEAIARDLIAKGAKNENYITDEVFYARYPGIHRRKLVFPNNSNEEMALVRDWLRIRDEVVRPILKEEDKPKKGKPKKGKPKKDKPKKGGPKKDKPKKDKPKKDKPKEDKPEKDKPQKPDPGFELPDLSDIINPTTLSIALDTIKATAEISRLIPGLGIFGGLLAGTIQAYQDLMTSIQAGDWVLGGMTALRNLVNLVNGLIGDVSYLITVLQDLGAIATAGSTATGPGAVVVASISGFIVFLNEISSIFNLLLDLIMLVLDALIIAYATVKINLVPMTDDELAAHKSLLVGYLGNGAADLISTVLDGLDVLSLGLVHGEAIDKFIKAWKGMSIICKYGLKALNKLADIWYGIFFPGGINIMQGKSEEGELDTDEEGLEELLATFLDLNNKFTSLDGGAQALFDQWPKFIEQVEEKFKEMSDGREPFEVAMEMFDQALEDLEVKISSMTLVQDQLEIADSNLLSGLEYIEGIESSIDEISIPEIDPADVDLGDNLLADGIEDVLEGGANMIIENLNKAIRIANSELDKVKDSLKEGIAKVKEELQFYRAVIDESQKVLSDYKEDLRTFIDSTREQMSEFGSFEDMFSQILSELGKVMGIEGEFNVETLKQEWNDTKQSVAEGLTTIQNFLAGNEGETTQSKFEDDKVNKHSSKESKSLSEETNLDNSKSQQGEYSPSQNTSNDVAPFQLKEGSKHPTDFNPNLSAFQLEKEQGAPSKSNSKTEMPAFAI